MRLARLLLSTPKIPTAPTTIGQAFGGGFYAGKYTQGVDSFYLIIAPKSGETGLTWKTSQTPTANTASFIDGLVNTAGMASGTVHPAARYCIDYRGGGFADWILPARDQLEIAYRNLKPTTTLNSTGLRPDGSGTNNGVNTFSNPTGVAYTTTSPAQTTVTDFKTGGSQAMIADEYFTSTEYSVDQTKAWTQSFSTGSQTSRAKDSAFFVRPFRTIKII